METEPWKGRSRVIDDDDSPAVYVSWEDAQELIEKLNAENGGGFIGSGEAAIAIHVLEAPGRRGAARR